ncbi:unnamed protein product [Allacma fusca]|uniref:Uncharacterized protein n=1 Tax=Allacma fusca TaxID=39272 RepID=A0A8J2P9S6_9HEXA|nr:unnamed protein product [Allacma fusca]
MIQGMWRQLLDNTGYIGAYFDFANGIILHGYFFTLIHFHWFQVDKLDAFLLTLQKNPLVLNSGLKHWKAVLLPSFLWILTFYMTFIWLPIVYQVDFSSWTNFWSFAEASGKEALELQSSSLLMMFFGLISIMGKFYHAFLLHLPHNVFGTMWLCLGYFLSKDFSNVLKHCKDIDKTLTIYDKYKRNLDSANKIMTPFNVHFVMMTLTYQSLHFFDALNTPVQIWKINSYLYTVYLLNFLYLPVKTLMGVKRNVYKVLCRDGNALKVSIGSLKCILYDLQMHRLAIKGGGFFSITSRFSGMIAQQLICYSMLNTIAKRYI